jgi:hypothetical protein
MAIKFIVAHRADPNNIGDIASNPLQYFLPKDEYEIIDVADLGNSSYPENVPLIVGGGGLIGNSFMGDFFPDLLESPDKLTLEHLWSIGWPVSNLKYKDLAGDFHQKFQNLIYNTLDQIEKETAPRFVWGAGHNGDSDTEFEKIKWPKSLSKYKLVGIRDYHKKSRFQWVPCASCMHPAFDKKYEIKNNVIWFEHKKQIIKDFGQDPIPRFVNSGNNMEQTIELLGSANIILTNSYHGAYWGTLLKKKVIVVGGAWSSKFKWLKHTPLILDKKDNWKELVDNAPVYETALIECRAATIDFWNKIQESL